MLLVQIQCPHYGSCQARSHGMPTLIHLEPNINEKMNAAEMDFHCHHQKDGGKEDLCEMNICWLKCCYCVPFPLKYA